MSRMKQAPVPDRPDAAPTPVPAPEAQPDRTPRRMPGRVEFVAMMALLMGLIALGIDLMLPGFEDLASDVGRQSSADVAPIVTTYFLGLAVGQLLWGPLADRYGRKLSLNLGLSVIIVGALASAAVSSLALLLATRFLWGFGASAARSTTMTVVRDRFRGDRMASVMSLIFSVFILVPVIAPTIGSVGLAFTSWRGLFVAVTILAGVQVLWLRRLPETLDPAKVRSGSPAAVVQSAKVVFANRVTVGYLLALTALSAAFTAWIALAEPIINGIYGLQAVFPFVFGGLAFTMAIASLGNSRVVERVGARRLVRVMLTIYVVVTGAWLVVTVLANGVPPLWVLLAAMAFVLMSHAFLQSNAQSLAMDPMGDVAGIASAVIGAVSLGVGTVLGGLVQVMFDDTLTPLVVAFLLSGLAAMAAARWAEAARVRPPAVTTVASPRP